MRQSAILMLGSLLALLCTASPCGAAGVAIVAATIDHVQVGSGAVFIGFDRTPNNPGQCAGAPVLTLADDLKNREYYLSLAMTALATGKSVDAWVMDCGWAPWTATPNVPKIYSLVIHN